jgi:hypothetical protein
MTKLLRCTVVLFLIILSGTSHSQSHDLDQLLGQIIKAYGGEEHLRKLDEQVQEWSVVALMGNRHGTDLRTMRAPDQLKVELTYPGKKETRIVNGETSYVIYGQKSVQAAAQPQRDAMRLQLMRLYSPLVLRDKRDFLTLTADGESHAITLLEHGVRVDYLVNTESWRIEKVVGSLVVNGSKMQFVTEYSDFTFHDGVLVHQRENKFAGGVNTAVLQLRQVSFDAVLENTDFLPREESANQPEQAQDDII